MESWNTIITTITFHYSLCFVYWIMVCCSCSIRSQTFMAHKAMTHPKKDDWFASKGFIYCYFNEYNTLILNTHLQYRGDKEIKLKQLAQLRQFIDDFASKVEGAIKVMILGDFNCDMIIHEKIERIKTSDSASDLGLEGVIENETKNIKDRNNEYLDVPSVLGPQYHKVSSFSSTTRFSEKCIDHIFVNHDVTKYGEQIGGKNDKLSDHYCVINDFYSH
eukprot:288110_1